MRDGRRAGELNALVASGSTIEVIEESLAGPEQDGHDHDVQLVDQSSSQVPLDGGSPASDSDVPTIGRVERLLEGRLDSVLNEMKVVPPFISMAGSG